MSIIDITIKEKIYRSKKKRISILNDFSLSVEEGDKISVVGESGAGKSTLLNILGLIDKKFDGEYLLFNKNIKEFDDREVAKKRNRKIGFVLQESALIDSITIENNIKLPIMYIEKSERKEYIDYFDHIIQSIGINHIIKKKPHECSGGERARAIFARGVIMKPMIILSDEPTASLDEENKWRIIELLFEMNREIGSTLITATHDKEVADKHDKVINIVNNNYNE